MTTKQVTRVALLMGNALLGLALATGAWAADTTKLVEDCAYCHGKDGVSTEADVPTIAGFSAPYTVDNLIAYKENDRPCPETKYLDGPKKGEKTDMCKLAKDLGDAEFKPVAEYFAAKPFVRAKQKFDPALAEKGKKIHDELCEKCHGDGGSLASDDAGILAGQWMPYLDETFKEYAADQRPQPKKMEQKMKKLDKEAEKALVHYYGSFQ